MAKLYESQYGGIKLLPYSEKGLLTWYFFTYIPTKVSNIIEKLKEYRTVLISSAAVTGKIDVREAV